MRVLIEVELGNEAMQSRRDVFDALRRALLAPGAALLSPIPEEEDGGKVYDENGNYVGDWRVEG